MEKGWRGCEAVAVPCFWQQALAEINFVGSLFSRSGFCTGSMHEEGPSSRGPNLEAPQSRSVSKRFFCVPDCPCESVGENMVLGER